MSLSQTEQTGTVDEDFWTMQIPLFTAQFPTYHIKPQKVWGRFHASEEEYFDTPSEIIPLQQTRGKRTYVMMQPYVLEPKFTVTIGLYSQPKRYHDQDSPIGEVIGSNHEGLREVQVGHAQAWYYHDDKTIVLWECFFDGHFRMHPLSNDANMKNLWRGFEHWLMKQFPQATTLATPFNDPIARSIEEYQAFLKSLGYAPIAEAAFGKAAKPLVK